MRPMPPSLPPPVDAEAIRSRFAGLAGPDPVAPTMEPAPLILRIARALQGFGAGVQGQGPQFLAQLAEERNRPQREYQARKERFDTRKQELATLGEQAVLSAEDRRAQRTTQLLDRENERDREDAIKRAGFKSAQAIAQMRGAFDLELQAKKEDAARIKQQQENEKEARSRIDKIAKELFDDLKISRQQARAFAEFEVNQTPLSKSDQKTYNRLEKYRRGAGQGGGAGKVMVEIQNPDGSTSVVPFNQQVSSAINAGNIQQGPRGVFIQGQAASPTPASPPMPSELPIMQAVSESGMLSQPQAQAAPVGQVFTRAQVQAHAKKTGRDPAAIEADLRARGFTVQ